MVYVRRGLLEDKGPEKGDFGNKARAFGVDGEGGKVLPCD